MQKRYFYLFPLFLFFVISVAHPVEGYTFLRILKSGDHGTDVQELQKILNSTPETRITSTGPGSPGQETALFGTLTRQAVVRFQNKYASEVLFPSGLSQGTGFVGNATLKKLNNMAINDTSISIQPNIPLSQLHIDPSAQYKVNSAEKIDIYQTDTRILKAQQDINQEINNSIHNKTTPRVELITSLSQSTQNPVSIIKMSSVIGKYGTNLTLTGVGLDSTNNVYFGPQYVVRNVPTSGTVLTFYVPNIPPGRYDIAIQNSRGISNTVFFVIQGPLNPPVRIDSISPRTGRYGQRVVVTSSGFTAQNNEIITTFSKIPGLSSPDGKTLTFSLEPEGLREISQLNKQDLKAPISIRVVNDNGYAEYNSYFDMIY